MHLSFKRVCNKEHRGVVFKMTSSSNFSQSTGPVGRAVWEKLLVLSRFHSYLREDEWNLCPLGVLMYKSVRVGFADFISLFLNLLRNIIIIWSH